MSRLLGILLLGLMGCNADLSSTTTSVTPSSSTTSTSTSTVATTVSTKTVKTIKTTKASVLIKQSGGAIAISDLANGLGTVGDTASEPKRVAMTFSLSSLVGKSVSAAKVLLYYNGKSSTSVITNLGVLSLYQISSRSSFSTSDYSATETFLKEVISNTSALSALSDHQAIESDVTDSVKTSVANADGYFTVKLRFANETGGGNNSVNLYTNYSSTVLDAYIPALEVTYE